MPEKSSRTKASYFLGFDGGGTKTECVLLDREGMVVTRSLEGPSNPLRTGYTRAWFALSEAADAVLRHEKITGNDIRGVCAGLGGAGRASVARRIATFLERSYPNAQVRVTTDLEIALEAAFEPGLEGMILLAGTGSAAFGRGANGRTARVGGRGPWISDEGSAFDIGRQAVRAVALAEENRGPSTDLSARLLVWHQLRDWNVLLESIAKNPDNVFPSTFPLVAELADAGDAVSREILSRAAVSLAGIAHAVAGQLGWQNRDVPIGKVGGVYGRSKHLDSSIEAEIRKALPQARLTSLTISPAEAAARTALQMFRAEGHAA